MPFLTALLIALSIVFSTNPSSASPVPDGVWGNCGTVCDAGNDYCLGVEEGLFELYLPTTSDGGRVVSVMTTPQRNRSGTSLEFASQAFSIKGDVEGVYTLTDSYGAGTARFTRSDDRIDLVWDGCDRDCEESFCRISGDTQALEGLLTYAAKVLFPDTIIHDGTVVKDSAFRMAPQRYEIDLRGLYVLLDGSIETLPAGLRNRGFNAEIRPGLIVGVPTTSSLEAREVFSWFGFVPGETPADFIH